MVYCMDSTCYGQAAEGKQYCAEHACSGGALTLYYWPVLGRLNASIRMLKESKTAYTHKTDFADIASVCSGYGANTDTYGPPLVKDGEHLISQSIAITVHIGQRTGFDRGVPCPIKALQFLMDANDFMDAYGPAAKTGASLKAFMNAPEAGKPSPCDEWLTNMERSIQGPWYFGERATYVDFFVAQLFDVLGYVLFDKIGCPLGKYPKLKGVVAGIRGLESAKSLPAFPICPADFVVSDAVVAEFKA